ncbi:MAG: hypothetical protein CHACPFDD_03472 [Phycisphaerae bacterium]|nr:hypothetical protein [Phycisphaerae bacterium]
MLKFSYVKELLPDDLRLDCAYAVGSDGVPLRADIRLADGIVQCSARTSDPYGLALLWPVREFGSILLETTRLPPRDAPYNLHVELARHRLLRINLKREEWGLFDYPGIDELAAMVDEARALFVEAIKLRSDDRRAAEFADRSLARAVLGSEKFCQFHASVFLQRRQQSGGFARRFLGVTTPLPTPTNGVVAQLAEAFEFVRVPFVWREIQPKEQGVSFAGPDAWVKACGAAKLPIRGGPLLNFGIRSVPDWMYIWENDYDSILEYAREHVRRTVKRFASAISSWDVVSGLHAGNVFDFSVEQIMELTRTAAQLTKQLAPRAQVIIDLTQPWGEYYARNQRTIPPLLYAEMAVQSGISFDAFGLQFLVGSDSFYVRDMFQVSSLIDRLANLGKPLHITAVACPSAAPADPAGVWRRPWSEETQSEWLITTLETVLSKPYVDSVCLRDLADGPDAVISHGGVYHADLSPKRAVKALMELRARLQPDKK